MEAEEMAFPRFSEMVRDMMNPVLESLRNLGGSASIRELDDAVIALMKFPEEIVQQPHGSSNRTEVEWRLAWARTYLKGAGFITNSSKGVWSLSPGGIEATEVDPYEVLRNYPRKPKSVETQIADEAYDSAELDPQDDLPEDDDSWKELLIGRLLTIKPDNFERLCQLMLRESGFIEVKVTGKSGDGGIDGHGTIRLGGLISFPVVFQCKRWKNSVPAATVRELRGSMAGRADKGLLIATSSFTLGARQEATRDGVPPIDLIDWQLLCEKLKELGLGVSTQQVERVEIDHEYFESL